MDCLEMIATRRSTRRFQSKLPNDSLLCQIVEAGRYAPSGGNNQSTHFLVISNPSVLKVFSSTYTPRPKMVKLLRRCGGELCEAF